MIRCSTLAVVACRAVLITLSAVPIATEAQAQDASIKAFAPCSGCHATAAGRPNGIGPNLNGVFNAPAGSRPQFAYSQAMATSKIRWTDATLDAFLADPQAVVPGNRMPYSGMTDAASRKAVIAYLRAAKK